MLVQQLFLALNQIYGIERQKDLMQKYKRMKMSNGSYKKNEFERYLLNLDKDVDNTDLNVLDQQKLNSTKYNVL